MEVINTEQQLGSDVRIREWNPLSVIVNCTVKFAVHLQNVQKIKGQQQLLIWYDL